MTLRPVEDTLAGAVADAVKHLDLTPADAAAVALALEYAQAIDNLDAAARPKLIGVIGPSLLRVLERLGASPMARAQLGKRTHGAGGESELDRLRASRPGWPR